MELKAQPSEPPDTERELDEAIDTVGAFLRTVGKMPLALDEGPGAALLFERWALHVLNRAPQPIENDGARREPSTKREWGAVRQFFFAHRKGEAEGVQRTVADLRAIVWAFVQSLAGIMKRDGEGDVRMIGELEKLRAAAATGNTKELRQKALAVADTLNLVISERSDRHREVMSELGERISTLGAELEQAKRTTMQDALTQINNRRAFDEYVQRTADLYRAFKSPALLLLVDVDHFKRINDTFGHPSGDAVLRALADCLSKTFLRRGDFVARYGGEEFGVVLRDVRLDAAASMASRLLEAVHALVVPHEGRMHKITVSIGVAELKDESEAEWIARADQALYQAKKNGRDRAVLAR